MIRIDDRSYFAFTSSGRLQIIRIGVGALNVDVGWYVSTRRSQSSGIELVLEDDRLAHRQRARHEPAGPGVVQRAGRDVHVVEPVADELHERHALRGVGVVAPERALRLARGARRVDHRGAGRGRVAVDGRGPLGRRRGRDQVVAGLHAVERLRRRTRPRADTFGNLRADAGEQRGELGIDEHDRGVAVVDDVGGLVVGQPVVDRHRRGPDLAGRVHRLDDAGRVLAAPCDLAARVGAEIGEHVRQLVRPGLEFGVRALPHVAASPVVDDGDLVGLTGCICREQVGHGRIRTTCRPPAQIQSPTQTIVCVRISEGRPSEILTQTRS